jgi:hypothetical protein
MNGGRPDHVETRHVVGLPVIGRRRRGFAAEAPFLVLVAHDAREKDKLRRFGLLAQFGEEFFPHHRIGCRQSHPNLVRKDRASITASGTGNTPGKICWRLDLITVRRMTGLGAELGMPSQACDARGCPFSDIATEAEQRRGRVQARERMRDNVMHRSIAKKLVGQPQRAARVVPSCTECTRPPAGRS